MMIQKYPTYLHTCPDIKSASKEIQCLYQFVWMQQKTRSAVVYGKTGEDSSKSIVLEAESQDGASAWILT